MSDVLPTVDTHEWVSLSAEEIDAIALDLNTATPVRIGGSLHVHEEVYSLHGRYYRVLWAMSAPETRVTAESDVAIAKPLECIFSASRPAENHRFYTEAKVQELINVALNMLMSAQEAKLWFNKVSRENLAAWARQHLAEAGFDTEVVGSSWAKLKPAEWTWPTIDSKPDNGS